MATSIHDFAFDYEQFDFAHLRDVLPVAQTTPLGDATLTLTLLSLEMYEAGFAAILLFEQRIELAHPERPNPGEPVLMRGMPAIIAHDDRGNRYEGHPRAGYGGGSTTKSEMREVYNFAPSLAPDARKLTLDMLFVTRLGWNLAGEPQWTGDDLLAGPWQATFSLPERT